MIYADVFEAIRALSPEDPVLYMKDRAGKGKLARKLTFEAFGTERGDTVILPRTGLKIKRNCKAQKSMLIVRRSMPRATPF